MGDWTYFHASATHFESIHGLNGARRIVFVGELDDGEASRLAIHVRQDLTLDRAEALKQRVELRAFQSPWEVSNEDVMSRINHIAIQANMHRTSIQLAPIQLSNTSRCRTMINERHQSVICAKCKRFLWRIMFGLNNLPPPLRSRRILMTFHLHRNDTTN